MVKITVILFLTDQLERSLRQWYWHREPLFWLEWITISNCVVETPFNKYLKIKTKSELIW